MAIHFVPVEIGVAGIEQPPLRCFDRHAGMTLRVPGEGDHQDFRRQSREIPDCLETEPSLSVARMKVPMADIVPLIGRVATPSDETIPRPGGIDLVLHDVDLASGKSSRPPA
jgi:hypothetical protein